MFCIMDGSKVGRSFYILLSFFVRANRVGKLTMFGGKVIDKVFELLFL